MELIVLVAIRKPATDIVAPGSAIVARPDELARDGTALCYYEGNLHQMRDLDDFEARAIQAAGRLVQRYPTIAKAVLPVDCLAVVGTLDTEAWSFRANSHGREALQQTIAAYAERKP